MRYSGNVIMELYRLIPGHIDIGFTEWIYPHIPKNRLNGEDGSIPRICVADTLDGCLTSMGFAHTCIEEIQRVMLHEQELCDNPKHEAPLWTSLWKRLRFPFTLLTFEIDQGDPALRYPDELTDLVPDASWTGEHWITRPTLPFNIEHVWLYDAKTEEAMVATQDGLYGSILFVSDSKWSNEEETITSSFAKEIKYVAMQELQLRPKYA